MIEFWHIPELMAHLEDDLDFCLHSLLLLRNDSIKHRKHNKTFVKKISSMLYRVKRNSK